VKTNQSQSKKKVFFNTTHQLAEQTVGSSFSKTGEHPWHWNERRNSYSEITKPGG
jgi:hypothetical protein